MDEGDLPVESKEVQAEALAEMLADIEHYCSNHNVDLNEGLGVGAFDWVAWLTGADGKQLGRLTTIEEETKTTTPAPSGLATHLSPKRAAVQTFA